jgi:drug/metabolite transporter (DMT)-like permease
LLIVSERKAQLVDAPPAAPAGDTGEAPPLVRAKEKAELVRRVSLRAWAALLIVWVVWGSTYLAIKVGDETMPPLVLAAIRYLVAGLIMFPAAARNAASAARAAGRKGAPGRYRPGRSEWLGCAVVGILLLGANGAVCVGETTVPSGLSALLMASMPLWLLGIDAALNRARLGLAPLAGLAIGLVGVGLLSGLGGGKAGVSASGVVIILVAAASWALGTILSRRVSTPSSPGLASAMQLLIGGTFLLALAAATGEFGSFRLSAVSGGSWLALAYLIVAGTIVAFSAYVVAVRLLPTAAVATYPYVNPVVAVLLGTLFLNERLSLGMLTGGMLIVAAVVLVVRRTPPQA